MKFKIVLPILCLCFSCGQEKKVEKEISEDKKIKLITLDPGHFHAALVHKKMYAEVDSTIYVFAPEGPEVKSFLSKIDSYNTREESPSKWEVNSELSNDYLEQMIAKKPGNVMIVAGKNSKKIDYILEAVKSGLNVYADKPLVISPSGLKKLKKAYEIAKENNVLIYDIMTERFEATTKLQKQLSKVSNIFGDIVEGTVDEPAISKESVHHFFKYVSGQPLIRPSWFFDVNEEGEGIVDVTTHLVDLVQWEVFPNQVIDTNNVKMISAKRWPTIMSLPEFSKVTGLAAFPSFLDKDIIDGKLHVYCNGEMNYSINGKHAKVSVTWNYQAPEGTGDTHYSIMRGTKSNLEIKQGAAEDYKPTLYVKSKGNNFTEDELVTEVNKIYKSGSVEIVSDGVWKVNIPQKFKIGHEAHFGQVTENFLKYLKQGELPEWEQPNIIAKYYTTMEGYKMAKSNIE